MSCGDAGDTPAAVPSTTMPSEPPPPSSTDQTGSSAPVPTTDPVTFRDSLSIRLAADLADEALAVEIVDGLDDAVVAQLEEAVSGDAGDPLLSFLPPTAPPEEFDSVVVFAFGNRTDADGNLIPGPTNEALAATVAAFVADHPVPVFAQWEVADVLIADGVAEVTSIDSETDADGDVVYLSTEGVAEKAVALAASAGTELGRVAVIAFRDHAARSVMTAERAGMTAAAPAGMELPADYDGESTQPWTRDRATFVSTDLAGRLLTITD
jgi:hypothetical protein